MGFLSASVIAGCKKEQSTNQDPASAPVRYQVTDRLQVNNEDGKPRPFNTLPVINDEAVALGSDALSREQVTLKNTSGGDLLLDVVANTDKKLTINGKKQSADIYQKYKDKYLPDNNGTNWSWTYQNHQ